MAVEISLVIPAYKAGEQLRSQLEKKIQILASFTKHYEVIVVFDGRDELAENSIIELQRQGHFHVIKFPQNHGKGHAVRAGMRKAKGKYIAYMDYDNDINPKIIKQMYQAIKDTGLNAILPSKLHELSRVKYSNLRKFYGKLYNTGLRLLFGINCRDTQVGAKIYTAEFIKKVIPFCKISGFAFEIEMLAIASKLNKLEFQEIPVRVNLKTQSSIRFVDGLRVIFDSIKLFFRLRSFKHAAQTQN